MPTARARSCSCYFPLMLYFEENLRLQESCKDSTETLHVSLLLQPRPALSSLPRTPWLTAPQAVTHGVMWILEMLAETRIVWAT